MPAFLLPMLLKGFGFVKEAIKAVIGFIVRHPWQSAAVLLLVACAWLWRANNGLHDAIKAERAAHVQTVANFKKAQADAEAVQEHNLMRVAQAYTDIFERKENALKSDRDSAVARYKRLLANAESYRSAPGNADLSAATDAACVAYSGTPCAAIPAKLKAAQDNTDQLVALIDWVHSVAAVPTSPGEE